MNSSSRARPDPPDIILGSPCTPSAWSRCSSLTPLPDTPEPDAFAGEPTFDTPLTGTTTLGRRTDRVRKAKEIYDPSDEPIRASTSRDRPPKTRIGIKADPNPEKRSRTPTSVRALGTTTKKRKGKAKSLKEIKVSTPEKTELGIADGVAGKAFLHESRTDQSAGGAVGGEVQQSTAKRKRRPAGCLPVSFKASLLDCLISTTPSEPEKPEPPRSDFQLPNPPDAIAARPTLRTRSKKKQRHIPTQPVEVVAIRKQGYISSSTFSKVLRLVANLAPTFTPPQTRYQGPIPQPPVWAEVGWISIKLILVEARAM